MKNIIAIIQRLVLRLKYKKDIESLNQVVKEIADNCPNRVKLSDLDD